MNDKWGEAVGRTVEIPSGRMRIERVNIDGMDDDFVRRLNKAHAAIDTELLRGSSMHRHYESADLLRKTALMVEEAGEALKEALDLTRPPLQENTAQYTRTIAKLHQEAVECGAMAIRLIAALTE